MLISQRECKPRATVWEAKKNRTRLTSLCVNMVKSPEQKDKYQDRPDCWTGTTQGMKP